MLVTLEKEVEVPYIINDMEVYINVYTDYNISIDEDIETGASFYDYNEGEVTYEIVNILEKDTENEIDIDSLVLTEDEEEGLQDFAERHSSHKDYEILEEIRRCS